MQIYKKGLAMGVAIEGGAGKIGKNTHLLVIMRVRLFQIIGILNLTNCIQLKKEMARNKVPKVCTITAEFYKCYIHCLITTSTQMSNS